MSKKINLKYNDTEYTLEFTRRTVQLMESRGFSIADITTKPLNTLPELFKGAFMANHKGVSDKVVDDIYSQLGDKEGLIKALAEMYSEPIMTLLDEPEKNIKWTMSE